MISIFKTLEEVYDAVIKSRMGYYIKHDPIHACWGFGVGPSLSKEEVLSSKDTFLWPRFDRPLEAVVKEVGFHELTQALLTAESGLFALVQRRDLRLGVRTIQACRYDLKLGISFVSQITTDWETTLRDQLPEDLISIWEEKGWLNTWPCSGLGGYSKAREEVYDRFVAYMWERMHERLKAR